MIETKRARKPRARHKDVIFGAIDERLAVLTDEAGGASPNILRIKELLDELRRATSKVEDPNDGE